MLQFTCAFRAHGRVHNPVVERFFLLGESSTSFRGFGPLEEILRTSDWVISFIIYI